MSELTLRKVFEMASRAGLTFGSSSGEASPGQPPSWTFTVSPDVRKYHQVATIEDFIRVREHAREEQRRRYQSITQGTGATQVLIPDPADISESPVAADGSSVPAVVQLRPISLFPAGPVVRNEQLCFILMPFAEELVPVYEEAIAPAATQAGLECRRADEIMKPGAIMAQVWQSLMESRVVVADLTNMNPNVFYELGLAHAIGHDVILLTQDKKWVPFDLQHMRWFKYQPDTHGLHLLRQRLRTAFKEVLGETALGGVKA
jgi:hypothetical protein